MWGTATSKFHDFWILTPGKPHLLISTYQNYFKQYKKIWMHKKHIVCKSQSLTCWAVWKLCVSNHLDFSNLKVRFLWLWNSGSLGIWKLEDQQFENWTWAIIEFENGSSNNDILNNLETFKIWNWNLAT